MDELQNSIKRSTPLTKNELEDLYRYLGFKLNSFELGWNTETGKKSLSEAYDGRFSRTDNGWGVLTGPSKIIVLDLDGDNENTRRAFELALPYCKMIVKTRKGYHFYFIDNGELKHHVNTKVAIDIIGGGQGRHMIIAPPSFYNDGTNTHHYRLLTYPDNPKKTTKAEYGELSPIPNALLDFLYSLGFESPRQNEIVEQMPAMSQRTDVPKSLNNIKQLCDCLTSDWLKEYTNWSKLGLCIKTISDDAGILTLFLDTSARATGYESERQRNDNTKYWNGLKPNGRLSIGSLKHWAKLCNPQKYFENARGDYLRLLTGSPLGVNSNSLCELFINEMAGDIMYSTSDKDFYIYDPTTTLWKAGSGVRAIVNHIVVDVCQRAILKVLDGLTTSSVDETVEARKQLLKIAKMIDGTAAVNLVNNFLPAFCVPNEDPLNYFDKNPALLPLQNGVWSFTEGKLIPYQREHYFTHKIGIYYNPTADTALIERAMNDWFKKDKETINFIQMLIGYFLTGYTDRQEFYIAWGSSAGNGKSLLWGELIPGLLGEKYYARVTSEAFADTGNPNNDQLYYLNGKRYAFMSEPRKGAKMAIDNELLKTITGDSEFTVQAKYKNKLTFKLTSKILGACNDLPELNTDDKGIYRRFAPFEQNVPCLDADEYDVAEPQLKQQGLVVKKDNDFVEKLLADKEGTLRWALIGAQRYIANPRTPMPDAMKQVKAKAKDNLDTITQWLRGNLEAGQKSLTFKEIKDEWKLKGLNFDQKKRGFIDTLVEKITTLGFMVSKGRPGKSEERVEKCQLVPDAVNGLID